MEEVIVCMIINNHCEFAIRIRIRSLSIATALEELNFQTMKV